jgi:hypothetical protein
VSVVDAIGALDCYEFRDGVRSRGAHGTRRLVEDSGRKDRSTVPAHPDPPKSATADLE